MCAFGCAVAMRSSELVQAGKVAGESAWMSVVWRWGQSSITRKVRGTGSSEASGSKVEFAKRKETEATTVGFQSRGLFPLSHNLPLSACELVSRELARCERLGSLAPWARETWYPWCIGWQFRRLMKDFSDQVRPAWFGRAVPARSAGRSQLLVIVAQFLRSIKLYRQRTAVRERWTKGIWGKATILH